MSRRLVLLCLLLPAIAATEPAANNDAEASGFDFWIGAWRVNLRVRDDDLAWQDRVTADARVWPILDGRALLELWDSEPIKGFSLRWYDHEAGAWRLWLNWPAEGRSAGSGLAGGFRHGRGEFFAESTTGDGKTLTTRYTFSDIAPDRLRWDDAYSRDGGESWTPNWIMEFTRVADEALAPDGAVNAHTYVDGSRCGGAGFRRLDAFAGRWEGSAQDVLFDGRTTSGPASVSVHRILDGCALMAFVHVPEAAAAAREFRLLTWNTLAGAFEENLLDNEAGSPFRVRFGPDDGGGLLLSNADAGHRGRWQAGPGDTLRLQDFRVASAGGSLARRQLELRRVADDSEAPSAAANSEP